MVDIPKTPKVDTRNDDGIPSEQELLYYNAVHIQSVIVIVTKFINENLSDVLTHDHDKISAVRSQWESFVNAKENKIDFKNTIWFKNHKKLSRHHVKEKLDATPDYYHTVNLFDLIHMCGDWVAARQARGTKYEVDFTKFQKILEIALKNTFDQMLAYTSTIDYPTEDKTDA